MKESATVTAFEGTRLAATGLPGSVAARIDEIDRGGGASPILVFDDETGKQIELDPRTVASTNTELRAEAKTAGRPRLGVIAREVTLLPRHWDWLSIQRGGASAALRRLIDQARKQGDAEEKIRGAREAIYRFMTAIAGNAPGYEEALRALFAGDEPRFTSLIGDWPADVREYIGRFSPAAFGSPAALDFPIPLDKSEAVAHAVSTSFGDAKIDSVERITGASGAGVFRIMVAGTAYLLRIEGAPDGLRDPSRQYTCMRIAADAGISPRLIYANAEHGIAITDFVHAGLNRPAAPSATRLAAVVNVVKKLHATPRFPNLVNYLDGVNILIDRCQATAILPKSILDKIRGLFVPISLLYPRLDSDLVSSHNDVNPGNVLFESRRAWLIDWEAAFAADRFVDLAAIANFFAHSDAEREFVLESYFGSELAETHRARLFLMQQANRLFYAMVTFNFVAAARPEMRLTKADIEEAAQNITVSEELGRSSNPETKVKLACALLNDVQRAFESSNYTSALSFLSVSNKPAKRRRSSAQEKAT